MDITEVSIIHHVGIVLVLLWFLTSVGWDHPLAYFLSLFYLFKVNERYSLRLRRRLQYEERKYANQRRLLCDSETVRWLNHAVEKIWPICMEQIASQNFLLPIIPWFLDKYKPWTAKQAVVQHLYLGRNPPMFTEIRVLGESTDDDHLVLELGMNFLSGDDMSAILAVQLRKRLGFGMWANMHITGMHVEGKVLVGVKFLREYPFLGRVRVCFVEPPYFQMTVKPIFNHGVDVTELPGVAGWLDNMLAVAFEQTLVEPNMLVVDVEKFVASPSDSWFTVDEKTPIAYAKVEVVEAADLKPSDLNGLADPYVKGHVGPYRFRTKIQKKTLSPKWLEEFKIPITSWEAPNVLVLELRDKDHIFDDLLGDCALNLNDLRGGQRHDKWLSLRNIKTGKCHLAVTILENEDKGKEHETEHHSGEQDKVSKPTEPMTPGSSSSAQNQNNEQVTNESRRHMEDVFEPINIEGQEKTGIWVHHPGSDVSQSWEPRRGPPRHPDTQLHSEELTDSPRSADSWSQRSDNDNDGKKAPRLGTLKRGLKKIGSMFHHSSPKYESPRSEKEPTIPFTPRPNVRAVGEKGTTVRVIYDTSCDVNPGDPKESSSPDKSEGESPNKGHMKGIANNIKHAGKSAAHSLKNVLSRKGSAKFKEDQLSELDEREGSQESDSGDAFKDGPLADGSPNNDSKESAGQKDGSSKNFKIEATQLTGIDEDVLGKFSAESAQGADSKSNSSVMT
ncbi:C2 domain-containing protein-like isoform X1 [Iris pallida]|uniref:C2 domain-containing protein-like isoform X1 n=1 Tax=Iris pallida TaxID=29817 RepID=A0AAX6DNU0_IRIPA|nr:C2 domain-containing protein-like isoform X1 [Iris pallida]